MTRHFFILSLFIACFTFSSNLAVKKAHANSDWDLYVSETDLFTVMFPGNPDERVTNFRIGDGVVAKTTEALSFIDQRPYKDVVKTYVVKMDQTFGPKISTKNMMDIANHELNLYQGLYEDQKPNILERDIKEELETVVANLRLSYEDMESGMQGVRVQMVLTHTSKFYQVFTGPLKDLNAPMTEEYFKSFNPKSGYIGQKGNMNEDWRRIESPLAMFSLKIPPVTAPYFSEEPKVSKEPDNKKERIGMIFTDPIWSQNMFYNVTGHQLESEMSFDLAEKALLEKHFKRHGRSMVGMRLKKDFIGETPFIEAIYAISPPKAFPYVNYARVRGMFLGNYIMVQEVVGPKHLVESEFTNSFFDLIEFTPKKAFQKEITRHMDLTTKAAQPKTKTKPEDATAE